jgi:hypothetical protein
LWFDLSLSEKMTAALPVSFRSYRVFMADSPVPRELFIMGLTQDGRTFRPSDWAERLAGVLACYRPEGNVAPHEHLGYSPYAKPTSMCGISGVLIDERLKDIEPRAYEFCVSFGTENGLQMAEVCSLDDHLDS